MPYRQPELYENIFFKQAQISLDDYIYSKSKAKYLIKQERIIHNWIFFILGFSQCISSYLLHISTLFCDQFLEGIVKDGCHLRASFFFFGFQGNKFFYLYRREIIIYSNRKISGKRNGLQKEINFCLYS